MTFDADRNMQARGSVVVVGGRATTAAVCRPVDGCLPLVV